MALAHPTSRIYSGATPLSAMYQGTHKVWEPAPVAPLTHPTIIGTPSVFPASNTTATILTIAVPTPAGATVGEGLVACLVASGASPLDVTAPAGWARIGLPISPSDGGVRILGWFFHKLTAPAASTYTFTAPAAGRFGAVMFRVENVNAVQPHTQWHAYGPRVGNTVTVYDLPGVAAPTVNSLYLVCSSLHISTGETIAYTVGPTAMTALTSNEFGLSTGSRSGLHTWFRQVNPGPIAASSITYTVTPINGATANGVVLAPA